MRGWHGWMRALLVGEQPPRPSPSAAARVARDLLQYALQTLLGRLRTPLPPADAAPPLPAEPPADARGAPRLISVVVPTYNEADAVAATVRRVLELDDHAEVIVTDGGSSDGTQERAVAAGARVVSGASGRAACMNAGASAARGDLLLFLHGDTVLPAGYGDAVRAALADGSVAVCAFSLRLEPRLPLLWVVEWGANARSRWRSMPYGDQALSFRRATFEALGGFPQQQMLEDVDLVALVLARRGLIRTLDSAVVTSSRRWFKFGVVGNTLRNQLVLIGHSLGVPVPRLARWYYGGASGVKSY